MRRPLGHPATTASKPLATFVVTFALPIALLLAAAKTRPEQILNLPYVATLASGLIGIWLLGLLLGRYGVGTPGAKRPCAPSRCPFPTWPTAGRPS